MSSESVDEDNLKISNSGSNGQFLQKQSSNAGGLTWAAVDFSAYAPLAAPALTGNATAVNLTLSGNLTVNGTTTTVATTNTTLTDNLLELNSGASSNANDAGILIERGSTGDNAIIAWDESADKFVVGTTTGTASSTGNITIATGTLVATVEGNASTATALQTGREIGGVIFDGTGDINLPGVNTGGTQNTSGNAATATILATARNIGGVSFNGSGNIDLPGVNTGGTMNTSGNAATATALETTRNIGGVGFNGTGNIDLPGVNTGGTMNTSGTAAGLSGSPNITVGTIGCGAITGTSTISDSKGDVRKIPNNATTSAYTLSSSDVGKAVTNTSGGVTVPNGVFTGGSAVTIINHSGSDITITQASGLTLHNAADAATGNRTLAARGMATVWFQASSVAYISGAGLS